VHPFWSDERLPSSNIASELGAAWPPIPRPSFFPFCQRHSQQFISRAKEKGVPHDSIIESPNREAQTGTEDLRHILVVDDDPMVCMAIEVYLQRNNFRVTIAEGGEAGLRALEHAQFDLMIIDIFMPHMRGFESVRIFHERAPAVPLIAMSGYAFANLNSPAPDFLRMALELGAARCLRKPFTPHALLAAINDCLAEHRPHGELASAARLG
jgi:CheY-like chemotaxis protein